MILFVRKRSHLACAKVLVVETSGSILGDQGRQRLEGLAGPTLQQLFVLIQNLELGNENCVACAIAREAAWRERFVLAEADEVE